MTRRDLLSFAAASAALAQRQPKRPNIVLLYTDDQRFDTVRALGNPDIQTPNMDRLAAAGTAFTHTFTMGGTHGAICVPSRGMLMTGRSLFNVHRDLMAKGAPRTFTPFPRLLADAGYRTFMSGKWHNEPEYFAATFAQSAENIFFGGMSDQFDIQVQDFDPSGKYPKPRAVRKKEAFASTLFADSAIRFIESHARGKTGQPYFVYVPFTAPHDPRTAPPPFDRMYDPAKLKLPPNFLPEHPFDNGDLKVRDEMLAGFPRQPDEVRRHLADYYAMVSAVDHEIGRILDAIAKSGEADNTFVIFAGDNGLAVGQHGLFGKQNLYDHSWRVPLIVSGPGVPRGRRVDSLTYLMDICPSICRMAGIAPPPGVEAQPLDWTGKGARRSHVFAAYRNFQRAIRDQRWKLIEYNVNGKRTTQLFDLAADPFETRNLAGDARQTKRIAAMRESLRNEMKKVNDPASLDAQGPWQAVSP